jgi:hypothetical protein
MAKTPAPAAKPVVTTAQVTIPAGQSLSNAADLSAGSMVMLMTPVNWTAANISFQVSEDNVLWRDLFDANGNEIVKAMGPNRAISVDPSYTAGAMWVKLMSGPRQNPVPQEQDATFTLVIQ